MKALLLLVVAYVLTMAVYAGTLLGLHALGMSYFWAAMAAAVIAFVGAGYQFFKLLGVLSR